MFRRKRNREASSDISPILESWEYDIRQEMMVRRIRGADGTMKIQMRLDLGLLQLNENGRPDGKKPHGRESLLSYFEEAARTMQNKFGSDEELGLDKDDCYALQQEGVQYYYRYLCFFQLGDYQKAERDTARNLRLFDFVKTHAAEEKYIEDFEQYRPYVMMMNTRARVLGALKSKKVNQAVSEIHRGINQIERVYERAENLELPRTEIAFLKNWADEIVKRYTPSKRRRLVEELEKAVMNEEFERAAKIRDRLNRMKE